MALLDFTGKVHRSTSRDYIERVVSHDKADCAEVALRFDQDYWDGDRRHGYGGYRYDGRWLPVAKAIADHYSLRPGARILDVGCGKAFLLHEFTRVVPNAHVVGIDISTYAIANAKEEVSPRLALATAPRLPFQDRSFDLVISLNVIHNLWVHDLWAALGEIERVARGPRYVVTEAYRNEREKANLLYWQLTCRAFHTPAEWEWIFGQAGYTGDWSFIYFE